MMRTFPAIMIGCCLLAGRAGLADDRTASEPNVTTQPTLTRAGARALIDAALAEAQRLGAPGGAIAVVDAGGHLISLDRLDGTFAQAAQIATGKARTAAVFNKPTSAFEDAVNKGRTSMVALSDFTPLRGGVPVVVEGRTVGAIGVSGAASADQDEQIAVAAVSSSGSKRSTAAQASVTYYDRTDVAAAFAKGMPLLEGVFGDRYKIHASRRESPGVAEVHDRDTDIFYVQEGAGTLVTGGRVIGARQIAPGEHRGSAVEGGESRQFTEGDVIVVPAGVPHWFKQIEGPVTYFTVKVAS